MDAALNGPRQSLPFTGLSPSANRAAMQAALWVSGSGRAASACNGEVAMHWRINSAHAGQRCTAVGADAAASHPLAVGLFPM